MNQIKFNFKEASEFILEKCKSKQPPYSVCVQISDDILEYSSRIVENLTKSVDKECLAYVVADGQKCCTDYINAIHVKADVIVKYGESCHLYNSATADESIPVFYDFCEVQRRNEVFENYIKDQVKDKTVVIFGDLKYTGYICDLSERIQHVIFANPTAKDLIKNRLFGRVLPNNIDLSGSKENIVTVYYGEEINAKILSLIVPNVINFNPKSCKANLMSQRFLLKRISSVLPSPPKVVAILRSSNSRTTVDRLIKKIKFQSKQHNIMVIETVLNKVTAEKLMNFQEVDAFISIGCLLRTFTMELEINKKIMSVFEYQMLLDQLNGVSLDSFVYCLDDDLLLNTGAMISRLIPSSETSLVIQADLELIKDKIENRTFKGLSLEETATTKSTTILTGRRGIAAKYEENE